MDSAEEVENCRRSVSVNWSPASEGVSSNGPEVVRCVDALKQLKKFPVTYDILVSTQVIKFPYLYMPLNFNSLPFFHV